MDASSKAASRSGVMDRLESTKVAAEKGDGVVIMAIEGELAQLVERCDRTAEVRGSSPLFSMVSPQVADPAGNPSYLRGSWA
jgi:hypothetical protein